VAADDRSGPVSGLSSSPTSSARAEGQFSASFEIAGWHLELAAYRGSAKLVLSRETERHTHMVEPSALAVWAVAITKLLSLRPAETARGRAIIRAPFIVDREGQPSIAFEAMVSEGGVGYRLLIRRADERLTSLATTEEVVRGLAQAAAGFARVGQPGR
jgi:hypothetical protein